MSVHTTSANNKRFYFLDNLRSIIIFLVVFYHVGGIYESSGTWASFWIVDDAATNDAVGIINLILDIFMMPTMFFVSGYVAQLALNKKGAGQFIQGRFQRLLLPWLTAVLLFIPLYKVIFLYSRGLPQESWTTYFHFSNGVISQSWLWFLPLLFVFNLFFVLLAQLNLLPSKVSFRTAVIITIIISFATSLSMDLLDMRGWTLTSLLDFQNERVVMYFLTFLLGALAFRQQLFAAEPRSKMLYTVVNSTAWLPIMLYLTFLFVPFVTEDGVLLTAVLDRVLFWLGFYLSLASTVYLLVESFRRYLNHTGPLWTELSTNSYYVYIIHVIVLGVVGLGLLNVGWPSLVKLAVNVVLSYFISNVLVSIYHRMRTGSQPTLKPEVFQS